MPPWRDLTDSPTTSREEEKGRCWRQGRLLSSSAYSTEDSRSPLLGLSSTFFKKKKKKAFAIKKTNNTSRSMGGRPPGWEMMLRVTNGGEGRRNYHCFCCKASFLAASCSNCVSTSSAGNCTYRTTEPRMKQFFTDN